MNTIILNSQNDKRVNRDPEPWAYSPHSHDRYATRVDGSLVYLPREEFTPARNSETNIILDFARDTYGSETGAWFAIGWLAAFQDFDEGRDLINEPLDENNDSWELRSLYEARDFVDAETWARHYDHAERVLNKMFDVWNAAGEYNN